MDASRNEFIQHRAFNARLKGSLRDVGIFRKSPCLEGVWIEQNRGLTTSFLGTRLPSLEYEIGLFLSTICDTECNGFSECNTFRTL